jgi:hypothetical protein
MLTPNAKGGRDIHLYGDLARILELCEAGERKSKRPERVFRGANKRWLRG